MLHLLTIPRTRCAVMLPPSASGDVNFTLAENPSASKSVMTASWLVCNSCHCPRERRNRRIRFPAGECGLGAIVRTAFAVIVKLSESDMPWSRLRRNHRKRDHSSLYISRGHFENDSNMYQGRYPCTAAGCSLFTSALITMSLAVVEAYHFRRSSSLSPSKNLG